MKSKDFLDYITDAAVVCRVMRDGDADIRDILFLYANRQAEQIMGIKSEDMVDGMMTELFPKMKDSIFDWPKIIGEAAMTNDNKVIDQYFVAFEKHLRLNIFGYSDDVFSMVISDESEKKEIKRYMLERDRQIQYLEGQLKLRANVDNLTGMYNYQFMLDSLSNSIDSCKDEGTVFSVLLLDIDDFADINVEMGTRTGDYILCDVAKSIVSVTRKIDVAGRYGNDAFIVIMNNLDLDIAKVMVERLKQDIGKHSVKIEGVNISVSGALAEYDGESAELFLRSLEKKLCKARKMGKGTVI